MVPIQVVDDALWGGFPTFFKKIYLKMCLKVFLDSFSNLDTIQCSVSFRIEVPAILFLFISTISSKKMQKYFSIIQKLSGRIFGGYNLL